MSEATWTLEHVEGALEQSFDAWRIDGPSVTRTLRSLASDVMTFEVAADFDSDPDFAVGDSCRIKRGGVGFFYGRVIQSVRVGEPGAERIKYTLAGPWWYFDNRAAEAQWKVYDGSAFTLGNKSRVIVGQDISGGRLTTGAAVRQIVDFVRNLGAPIEVGAIFPGIQIPFGEFQDQTCAELIRLILRWTPDVMSFFDYSTARPTLHFVNRSMGAEVFRTLGADGVQSFTATPRYDLQLPGVKIYFEQTSSVDSETRTTIVQQIAGSDTWGTLVLTMELSGSSLSFQRQTVQSATFDLRTVDFWKKKHPWLANAKGPDGTGAPLVEISTTSAIQDPRPPNSIFGYDGREMIGGAVPSWLSDRVWPTTCKALISYSLTDENGARVVRMRQPFSVGIQATSLSGEYTQKTSDVAGEEIPAGLAAGIYAATSFLHWEGTLVLREPEVSGLIRPGNLLNIFGGRAEWETMGALVQQVQESVGSGQTVVTIGPANQLGPQDYLELQRMNRMRRPTYRLAERVDGKARPPGSTSGPHQTSREAPAAAAGAPKTIVMAEASTTNPGRIVLTVDDIVAAVRSLSDKDIRLREVYVCVDNAPRRMLVLGSAPYET